MTLFSLQVLTRLVLSSSPFFYWLCAVMTSTRAASRRWPGRAHPWRVFAQSSHLLGDLLHAYLFAFNAMGFLFFTNRYPWT